jgi:hypothetical protein
MSEAATIQALRPAPSGEARRTGVPVTVRLFGILAALTRERLVVCYLPAGATVAITAVGMASVIGDFFVKYTIAKAEVYIPLRPRVSR